MELLQLKYFLVTAQYQHMTKAADFLHIAQPALSQAIKRLEKGIRRHSLCQVWTKYQAQ
ncbi:LysR family transcriptional regulator [Emergencia timonensis]|uniref:LysR family transcriptional regulator n=1 Tax=Emergencia timonensis TaxID=1776384 RepID=UPI00295B3D91|nr:LysR family transcriptional regulator [Emergencia timonensis]WNX88473.1 LysR family transcriptional regulator [Emergencia timonensis]